MKNTRINLFTLKTLAVRLRCNYQLPFYLTYLIRNLNKDTDIKVVALLSRLSEDLMRVKGYYKKYPDAEKSANDVLKKQIAFIDNNYVIYDEKGMKV